MYGKGEFSKTIRTICNIPIESANICSVLQRQAGYNGLIVVKLKPDLKYRGYGF